MNFLPIFLGLCVGLCIGSYLGYCLGIYVSKEEIRILKENCKEENKPPSLPGVQQPPPPPIDNINN